ncbi:MAG TPA: L-seryl-tRNA(Sec) selenium transferase, partial [Paraburkholderia sp.]
MSEASASELNARLARVPAVERMLSADALQPLVSEYGRTQVVDAVRVSLEALRGELLAGGNEAESAGQFAEPESSGYEARIVAHASSVLAGRARSRLRAVFNLTGTVLHTNLGRALLPDEAVRSVIDALTRPTNLEFDLDTGARGDRDDLIGELICELT